MQGNPGTQITGATSVELAVIVRVKHIDADHVLFHRPRTGCRNWPSGGIFRQMPFAANLWAANNSFTRQLCFA
jgi:hypothetical protein